MGSDDLELDGNWISRQRSGPVCLCVRKRKTMTFLAVRFEALRFLRPDTKRKKGKVLEVGHQDDVSFA